MKKIKTVTVSTETISEIAGPLCHIPDDLGEEEGWAAEADKAFAREGWIWMSPTSMGGRRLTGFVVDHDDLLDEADLDWLVEEGLLPAWEWYRGPGPGEYWIGVPLSAVREAEWTSAHSGARLIAEQIGGDEWELTFIDGPQEDSVGYRALFEDAAEMPR